MKRAYKYKLKPTMKQQQMLLQHFGCARFVYNWGKNLLIIDRFEPSSKTCNSCGYVYKELTLSERSWKCPICGEVLYRDVNAAKNIRDMALRTVV